MHRHIGAADILELDSQLLFRRVDDDGAGFAEHEILDNDEAEQFGLVDSLGVEFVDLLAVDEDDAIEEIFGHARVCAVVRTADGRGRFHEARQYIRVDGCGCFGVKAAPHADRVRSNPPGMAICHNGALNILNIL